MNTQGLLNTDDTDDTVDRSLGRGDALLSMLTGSFASPAGAARAALEAKPGQSRVDTADQAGIYQDAGTWTPRTKRGADILQSIAGTMGSAEHAADQFFRGIPGHIYRSILKHHPEIAAGAGLSASLLGAAAPEAEAAAIPKGLLASIVKETAEHGGSSRHILTGAGPDGGIMAGKYANTDARNTVLPKGEALTQDHLEDFVKKNKKALAQPDHFLGTWQDPDSGKTYLDVSKRHEPDNLRGATKFAEGTGQLSVYDSGTGTTHPVGNWQSFIESPEYHDRLHQMAAEGRAYLDANPDARTKEWWDLKGTGMNRVYGDENLPHVAGYTAATAPNTAPPENIQMMSEYMRRHIKGEPIVQPAWRTPEGTMSRNPGKQIGMEGSRKNNLIKALAGDLDAMRGPKVRSEALAFMGDPDQAVIDRHQIRLAEDPARGIYAGSQEGVLPAETVKHGDPYYKIVDQMKIAADKAGRPLKDFSADVWTGIRERIRNTSDLFGEKYAGHSVRGESYSYADHFDQLVQRKATHLGISTDEMESRLKRGDTNLLGIMLATPAGMAAYKALLAKQDQDSGT